MFGVYDYENEGFISLIDNEGCCVGEKPIIFDTEELAEAFVIWFCAWHGDDEELYDVVCLDEFLNKN